MAGGALRRKPSLPPLPRLDKDRYLPFIPTNEQEVVALFTLAAPPLEFTIEHIGTRFPDCTARLKGKRVRIEFEFRSRNFKTHGHDAGGCDLIVCWKHDWAGVPQGVAVLEMRKLYGLDPEVFMVAYQDQYWTDLPSDRKPTGLWSVPSTAGPGDLLLVYRPQTAGEQGAVTDIFEVVSLPQRVPTPLWRDEPDWMASIQLVAQLRDWLPLERLRELGAAGGIESRPRRTDQWPQIYRTINDECRPTHSLRRFAPPDKG